MDSKTEKALEYISQLRELGRRNKAWRSLITSMCDAFEAALAEKPEQCESCKFYEGCEHTFEHKPIDDQEFNIQKEAAIAFVKGAKWWEWHKTNATMWQSDQALAAEEAGTRYKYKPTLDDLFPSATFKRILEALAATEPKP